MSAHIRQSSPAAFVSYYIAFWTSCGISSEKYRGILFGRDFLDFLVVGKCDTGLFGFEESTMAKTRVAHPPEFRRQMVELVRAGRTPEALAHEFEPTAQSIRNWVAQWDRNAGRGDGGLPTRVARRQPRTRSSSITSISDQPSAIRRSRMAYCNVLLSRLCRT
jgi:transposase-like protein